MSFSWKGLLGVNGSSTQTSTTSNSAPSPGATVPASRPVTAPVSASSTGLTTAATNGQSTVPAVPLFSGMIPATPHHSTSYIPPSTPQAAAHSKPPAEMPINLFEGGSLLLGMENFGNTCYVNSMLQSLYFCRPFRDSVLSYRVCDKHSTDPPISSVPETDAGDDLPPPDTLFASLRDLFEVIQQTGQDRAMSSPTHSTFLSAASPITPSLATSSNVEQPAGVSRRISMLGRPATGYATPGKGAASSNTASVPTTAQTGTTVSSISSPPTLTINTTASQLGINLVDSTAIKGFIGTLKRENVLFDSTMHQDAHEMLNFVLNKVGEDLIDADRSKHKVKLQSRNPYLKQRSMSGTTAHPKKEIHVHDVGPNGNTCVHRLFEGVLTNETRCLTCETVTSRDECFLDLSIDIEQNSSLTSCLRQFSASEMLQSRNKFFCDSCSGLQEAEKRMKIKKLPNVLALHLKRFKYEESVQRYVKLAYRVAFPLELRLFNTSDDAEDPDRLYELFAIVVHIGAGPHHGHYIAVVKVGQRWIQFDDDAVTYIDEEEIQKYYGDKPGLGSAYVLFYQAANLDFQSLGLDEPAPVPVGPTLSEIERGRLLLAGTSDNTALRNGLSPDRSSTVANRLRVGSVGIPTSSPASAGDPSGGGWFGNFRNRDKRSASQSTRRPKDVSESGTIVDAGSGSEGTSITSASILSQPAVMLDGGGSHDPADLASGFRYKQNLTAQEGNAVRGSTQARLRAASESMSSSSASYSQSSDVPSSFGSGGHRTTESAAVVRGVLSDGAALQQSATQPSSTLLDRQSSKKDQKVHAKSKTPSSGPATEKDGMLSNLFSSSQSQSKRSSTTPLGSSGPPSGSATPADKIGSSNGAQAQPARKPSISSRALSKTFGFGRK